MKEGDTILTPLPQADGTIKNRPAIILREMPLYRDFLVCGVSTQLKKMTLDFDEIIAPSDADFPGSGLKRASLIRLGFLSILPRRRIIGSIGAVSTERHRRLLTTLSEYLAK